MLSQVGIKEGIRRFGEKGNDAPLKELNQLHKEMRYCQKEKKT